MQLFIVCMADNIGIEIKTEVKSTIQEAQVELATEKKNILESLNSGELDDDVSVIDNINFYQILTNNSGFFYGNINTVDYNTRD